MEDQAGDFFKQLAEKLEFVLLISIPLGLILIAGSCWSRNENLELTQIHCYSFLRHLCKRLHKHRGSRPG